MKKAVIVFSDILLILFSLSAPYLASAMMESGPTCYFLEKGIICPSCGGTRCVYAFFTGAFKQAFLYNFSIFCGLLLLFFVILLLNIHVFFKNERCIKIIRRILHPVTLTVLILLYVILGLLRNFF